MSHEPIDKSILQTFVPINTLAEDQLEHLLQYQEFRVHEPGDVLFSRGERDGTTIYLLSGEVELEDESGEKRIINADGEESWHPLEHHQPRRSTARARTAVSLVCFDSFHLDTILAWDQAAGYMALNINNNEAYREDREWMIRLLHSRLFYDVPPGNVLEIFRRLKPQRRQAGEIVIQQGDGADCCYIIKEGLCQVSVQADETADPVLVATLEPGQWFGEEALLSGKPRNATVTMATEGTLMRLDRQDFDELLREPVVNQVTVEEALRHLDAGARWLDVRTTDEFEQYRLRDAVNLPLENLRNKVRLLEASRAYIACCDTGRRSASAAFLLRNEGIEVHVLEGGINGNMEALEGSLDGSRH